MKSVNYIENGELMEANKKIQELEEEVNRLKEQIEDFKCEDLSGKNATLRDMFYKTISWGIAFLFVLVGWLLSEDIHNKLFDFWLEDKGEKVMTGPIPFINYQLNHLPNVFVCILLLVGVGIAYTIWANRVRSLREKIKVEHDTLLSEKDTNRIIFATRVMVSLILFIVVFN